MATSTLDMKLKNYELLDATQKACFQLGRVEEIERILAAVEQGGLRAVVACIKQASLEARVELSRLAAENGATWPGTERNKA